MTVPSRRRFVSGVLTAGAAAGLATAVPAPARADGGGARPTRGGALVTRDDPRYPDLAQRGSNKRFTARPDAFCLATSTAQVVAAAGAAVRDGKRIAVRSGGHCYENFVGDPAVRLVLDLGEMDAVAYDPQRRAFMAEAGARLLDVYEKLYYGWGVTLPGGASATVGLGGHLAGGGYGALSRAHGLAADHLYAVEVVVVDAAGRARAVVATREPDDPHRELWWAHTGGGGGNFGVVTRYWFRSPGAPAHHDDPALLLPRPPATVLTGRLNFARDGLDRAALRRLLRNHGRWHEQHSGARSPYAGLFGGLVLYGRTASGEEGPAAAAHAHMDGDRPGAARLLREYFEALAEGLGGAGRLPAPAASPWLAATRSLAAAQDGESGRFKIKSAYLRRGYRPEQADTLYDRLNAPAPPHDALSVSLQSFGGRINTAAPGATASAHRDSVLKALYMNTWQDAGADAACVDWLRRLYRDVYADTGGVPAPGRDSDGCYINYPDIDMADPAWNTSGVPWHRLYHGNAYPRLRRVKATWDPRGVFGGTPLSVRPEAGR
ncbi:FAD-binding protein [Streptomyces sp. S186]|uniref:FAD-binding protein n=1 Tax=Streptomyces sp. S186 TaxID=3434395 RepID=UPI003F67DBA0